MEQNMKMEILYASGIMKYYPPRFTREMIIDIFDTIREAYPSLITIHHASLPEIKQL